MRQRRVETGKGICPGCGYWVLRGGREMPVSGWWHKSCLDRDNNHTHESMRTK